MPAYKTQSSSVGRTIRRPPATAQEIRRTLLQDVLELIARTEQATEEFEAIPPQVPNAASRVDGAQRVKNASAKLSVANKELMKAYQRLDEYFDTGHVEDDLELRD